MMTKEHIYHPFQLLVNYLAEDRVLSFALVASVVLHIVFVFGVTFTGNNSGSALVQKVANVFNQNEQENKNADFVAQTSQKGQGAGDEERLIKSPFNSPVASDKQAPINDIKNTQKKQSAEQYMQSYLRATVSLQKVNAESENKADNKKTNDAEDEENRIMAQIATLEAQFSNRQQTLTKSQGVKTLTSLVDTKGTPEAAYMNQFIQIVTKRGNDYMPRLISNLDIKANVRLKVSISQTGKLKGVWLLSSSGNKLVDNYALETVRDKRHAFPPFSKEMLDNHLSQVDIIRTWSFFQGTMEDGEG